MIGKIQGTAAVPGVSPAARTKQSGTKGASFDSMLSQRAEEKQSQINFSKHALARAEERGIELTPTLMDKLAGSVEKAQEKGARNILAFDANRAFIINIPCSRVITTMSQDEMRENIFTNIDGAVLL